MKIASIKNVGWVLALILGVCVTMSNLASWREKTRNYSGLARQALKETLQCREDPACSLNPQRKWWPIFWRMGHSHEDAEIRRRSKALALTMLNNLGEHHEFLTRFSELDPFGQLAEDLADQLLRACLGLGEHTQYRQFALRQIQRNPNSKIRQKWVIRLVDHLIGLEEHEEADALARRYGAMVSDREQAERLAALRYEAERLRPGLAAPHFAAAALDGRRISSRDFKGRPLLLFFWAPDCAPSLAVLEQLALSPPKGVELVSIALGARGAEADASARGYPWNAVQVPAPDRFEDPLALRFNVSGTPTLTLIDSSGRLRGKFHSVLPMLERLKSFQALSINSK